MRLTETFWPFYLSQVTKVVSITTVACFLKTVPGALIFVTQ